MLASLPPPSICGPALTDSTTLAIRDVLDGRRRGLPAALLFAGPAVISSIAYVDPGNFATNIQAGARYGYTLLWVVVVANLLAMLFQSLSARLGIVTGRNLAELCRAEFSRPTVGAMWLASEVGAMATDLAEFLGGAIAFSLLFHIPLMAGMVATAAVTLGILHYEKHGFRAMELLIGGFVAVISLCYLVEVLIAPIDWPATLVGSVTPRLPDAAALTIAVGIIGATVMPHALYLHSGLTQNRAPARDERERAMLLRFSNREVWIALGLAGLVNMAMVMMAAAAFHLGHSDVAEIETAYKTLTPLLGSAAAFVFLVSLLASGLSSSAVGTMAGQMIMQGFVGFRIPLWLRRAITMAPAFVVVGLGVNATDALILSQVVLSFVLPIPMVALVLFTRRADIMGRFVTGPVLTLAAVIGAMTVLGLNVVLIAQAFGIAIPGLASD